MSHFRAIIIGAGAAGIAAASRLAENGMTDFVILEAENRIGGRLHTTNLGNKILELGAEWVHGEKDNITYELASPFNLVSNETDVSFFNKTSFFNSSGIRIDKNLSETLSVLYYNIIDFEGDELKGYQGSIGEYFKARYFEELKGLKDKFIISDELANQFLEAFHKWENSIDGSHSWYETSASGHLEYWECDGNPLTVWKENVGYRTILDVLTKRCPDPKNELPVYNKILLNKVVSKINYNVTPLNGKADVTIDCTDGSTYTSNHVIVTCSLGVLKDKAAKIFSPPLPQEKLNCIEGLGFGTVDKIFLKFPKRWWTDDQYGFCFLWSDEEKRQDPSGWISDVMCFHPVSEDSTILRGWIIGDAARHAETLSDNEFLNGLMFLFKKFLGSKYDIPKPETLLRSKWYSNPNFRGSYSCRLLKSESMNVWASQLAAPILNVRRNPLVMFAGEATHDHYFSTVHGAIETGRREADRLLSTTQDAYGIKNKYQVTIIGAGISGLAAAKTFIENGIKDILIIESQPEPGGRIRSVKIDDDYFELGAQWIHGEGNEIYKIAQENNLLTGVQSREGEGLYLKEDGTTVDKDVIREVDDFIKDTLEHFEIYSKQPEDSDMPPSIGEGLNLKFLEFLNGRKRDEIAKGLFDWHVKFQKIDNSCDDLNVLSTKAWGLYEFCGGLDCINFTNGYVSLVDVLLKNLPPDIFLCSTPVQRIEWKRELHETNGFVLSDRAEVVCDNDLKIKSDYVLVTCSLGFLKENHERFFRPPLPGRLSGAIDKMGFGVMDKIFLIYPDAWWEPDVKGFQLIWSSDDGSWNWARDMTGFDVISPEKPFLLGWIGGEGAKEMEGMTDNDVAVELTEVLRYFTKNEAIPLPMRVVRSRWWCNEFVRGGYSHITTACDADNIDGTVLGQPVMTTVYGKKGIEEKPTILLAGEAVHKTHFSTVHGAFESGQNQAQIIIKDIQSCRRK